MKFSWKRVRGWLSKSISWLRRTETIIDIVKPNKEQDKEK